MIVPGSTSQALAAELAAVMGEPLAEVQVETFPDGELLAGAPGVSPERATIVTSTTSATAHLELLQLQDAMREAGADEIVTVLAYMGYARQDAPMAPGKSEAESPTGYPLSARAVAKAIGSSTDRVLVVNPHEESVLEHFPVPAAAVSAASELATALPEALTDPLFLSPDAGARDLAKSVRDAYGSGEIDHFEKSRTGGDSVEIVPNNAAVADRDVIVTDDIIATGGTMSEAIAVLQDRDVGRVYTACVHPLLTGPARTRLANAGVEAIIGTDTIERQSSVVSAAPVIASELSE